MDAWRTVLGLLPGNISAALQQYPMAEEIRLRLGKQPGVVIAGKEICLCNTAVKQEDLQLVLEKSTGASLHAAAPALRAGYIDYHGIRIGVCGQAVYTGENMSGLRNFSSLAIRIPHPSLVGCAALIDRLLCPRPENTLICAPPGVGKTSFLRELIRQAANQELRIGVIDDRNELSASFSGLAQFDLGQGSDVLVGIRKARAAMMLLRGMNPQIIAMDEITQEDDLQVLDEITGCGVLIFATIHGSDAVDMKRRPLYKSLLERGIFETLVTIRCTGGRRIYERTALK